MDRIVYLFIYLVTCFLIISESPKTPKLTSRRQEALGSSNPCMDPKPRDLEDLFESSVKLEETHLEEGYREGFNEGLVSGKEEGREVGLKHGFEVGEELGFYRGCVDVWNSAIRVDPAAFSARVMKSVGLMEELLEKYPILEPENESLQEIMDALRLKFRVISASLGVRLEYQGYPKEDKGIQF